MAIDTSAFDRHKEASTTKKEIDISAFGYEWVDETPKTTDINKREPVGDFISAPDPDTEYVPYEEPKETNYLRRVFNYFARKGGKEGQYIFGHGDTAGVESGEETIASEIREKGVIGFWYEGLAKSDKDKIDDRVLKLMEAGVSKERAYYLAYADVHDEKPILLPGEEKALKSVGRWELLWAGVDTLDFVPIVGQFAKGTVKYFKLMAKTSDKAKLIKLLNQAAPYLDDAAKAKAIRKIAKTEDAGEVQRIVGEAAKETAARIDEVAPIAKSTKTGDLITKGTAAVKATADAIPGVNRALRAAADVTEYSKAQRAKFAKVIREGREKIEVDLASFKKGEPQEIEVYRGFGGDGTVTTRAGQGILTSDAKYFGFSKEYASLYGKKVEKLRVNLEKPYVIRHDDDLAKFKKDTGAIMDDMVYDNESLDAVRAQQASQRKWLLDNGYDSVIVALDKTQETKRTRRLFDNSQVIVLDDAAQKAMKKVPEAVADTKSAVKSADVNKNATTIDTGTKKVKTYTDVHPANKVDIPQEELGAIKDIAKVDQTRLRPTRAIGTDIVKGRNLAKEVEGNIAKYNQKIKDPEVVKIREQNLLGKETIEEIIARKRGIITDAESINRAKMIKGTLQDVIDLPKGTTATKEQIQAIEQIVQNERNINKGLQVLLDNGGKASTQAERNLLKRLGEGFEDMPEHAVLNHALAESTLNLKRAEVVLLGIRAETGRALQSMNKVVDGVDNRLRILFNKINANKGYDELQKQAIFEMIAKADISDNVKFNKLIEQFSKADFWDIVAEWSVAAKLWNPTTHIVNFTGNTLRQFADISIKTVSNPMAAKADMMGATVGFKRGLSNSLKAFTDDGYAAKLSKYIETGGTDPAIKGWLGKAVRTPFRWLGASDEVFKSVAYQRKLYRDAYGIAKKEGLKGDQLSKRMEELLNAPTFKMMDNATAEAKKMTFQEDLGEYMTKLDKLRSPSAQKNFYAKGAATFTRFFVPFLKTPTNLFKQAVDFSPLSVIKNPKNFWDAVKAGDREKVATILGEAIIGTAIGVYVAGEVLDGNVTGGAPRNSGEKDRFYRENKIPYAIKIGDTWYQYKRVDPFASTIGLTADLVTLQQSGEDFDVGSVFGVFAENLKDKTYLSGLSDLMKVLTGDDWERDYALKSMALGAILPSFVGHTTRAIDPNIRVADTLGQRLLVQIPGVSDEFPSKVNVLGYDIERANKGLNYFFNPIQMESATIDPVTQELMDINKTIPVPAATFQKNGVKYEFSDAEYEDYARFVGIKLRMELTELFKSPKYKRGDVDEKIALINKKRTEIQKEYKEAYVEEKMEGAKPNKVQQAKNIIQGKDPNAPVLDDKASIRSYFMNE